MGSWRDASYNVAVLRRSRRAFRNVEEEDTPWSWYATVSTAAANESGALYQRARYNQALPVCDGQQGAGRPMDEAREPSASPRVRSRASALGCEGARLTLLELVSLKPDELRVSQLDVTLLEPVPSTPPGILLPSRLISLALQFWPCPIGPRQPLVWLATSSRKRQGQSAHDCCVGMYPRG